MLNTQSNLVSRKVQVEEVNVPSTAQTAHAYSHADYTDAYRAKVPANVDVVTLARAIFTRGPRWVSILLWFQDRFTDFISLITSHGNRKAVPDNLSYEPGTQAGIFHFQIYQRSDHEILMGADNRFNLDFRVSLLLQPAGDYSWAVLSTAVHFNGWLGWVNFIMVRRFHRIVTPALLKYGVQQL